MTNEIINKVAKSGIINLDLEDYAPRDIITELDLKDFLFEGLILKEKYFRESLKDHNWSKYRGNVLALFCSSNCIIPMWAYMLVTSYLEKNNLINFYGNKEQVFNLLFLEVIGKIDIQKFKDKRVIIKGCGNLKIHEKIYVAITKKIQPAVKSLMFGEACSSVPIHKK
ncbi:MAG: DUF2480 family protein [Flavobacteriales bacterium]|jgi:hypothetical protein|tara:strand:- start:2765 stop:3268 length:504 start_codon:yes stop_codon:yes gene_type:complete